MVEWDLRRRYIKALGDLRTELSREVDRAQVGEELERRDDRLTTLIQEAQGCRSDIVRQQEIDFEAANPGWGA